ncbi:CcdB-like toxin protein [gamma proteobacterium IMCC2047]|nr:CcdB-like toxin protein [gamma proteobacterium IMCC2047]
MAQFDVYENPSKSTRRAYPYILELQNDVISELATRIVVPLADMAVMGNEAFKGLTPRVSYEGTELLILIPQIASMSTKSLKNPIGSLSHLREEIIASLDFAITGV